MHKYQSLTKHLDVRNTNGSEVTALCPFHPDTNPSFRFNTGTGLWVCYSCGEKGNAKTFMRRAGAKNTSSHEVLGVQVEALKIRANRSEKITREPLDPAVLTRFEPWHPAWRERGFNRAVVKSWGLGYDPLTDRLTIPARDHRGNLVGVIYRKLGDEKPRYVYPKNFPKKELLFGSWKLSVLSRYMDVSRVTIVEGPLDAVRVWQAGIPALALYGAYISSAQATLLHKLGVKSVVFFFDNDETGHQAVGRAKDLRIGINKSFVDWYGYKWGKDPGNLSLVSIKKLVDGAL